ncbi:MAG TPA: nuclear transport factor 2 family protein [Polyangiaceae bacterium]|nr:nuclear transport factor 2 family protein [Polyangiaceae bacterium]
MSQSSEVVRQFFAAFSQGALEPLVALFDPQATLIAVRQGQPQSGGIYGTYRGHHGVRSFIDNVTSSFDTQAFAVDEVVGQGEVAFAKGSFVHHLKGTQRLFSSDWALMCRVVQSKIVEFRFFEDSAALLAARQEPAEGPAGRAHLA